MDAQLLQAATENFSLPHDVVPLPSGGIFYKSKKSSVKVGYLTANDENIILNAVSSKDNLVLTLLRNKLYEHDLRPEELLEGDAQAILIFLRNTSFGSEYIINIEDPKTGKMFEANVSLDEMNIRKPQQSPNEEGITE